MEPQNIVVRYVFDTDDIDRTRKLLYGLTGDEADLADEFKRVNAELAKQAQAANGGTAAVGKEAVEVGKLAKLYDQLAQAEKTRKSLLTDDAVKAIDKEIAAIQREIKEVKKLGDEGGDSVKKVGKEGGKLGDVFKGIVGYIAAAFAADRLIEYAKQVISVTAEFQKFRAVLTNTLGSASEADKVLGQIQLFASKTPFSVKELTADFIKLAGSGFKPTAEELRKLGDLASSKAKSFDQLTEAVLDAQTGEFERLKEFGIKASKAGDQVTFTFNEQKKTVANTSAEIRKYLLSLGDLQGVSGSMAAISGTLEGQFSNLGDTVDSLFLSIGKKLAPTVSSATGVLSNFLQAITKRITEGSEPAIAANKELAASISPLLDRYDVLKGKTNLSAREQEEMRSIIEKVATQIPTAISGFDSYGKAIDISTEAGRNFVKQQILVNEQLNKKQLTEQRTQYRDLTSQIRETQAALAQLVKQQKISANDYATLQTRSDFNKQDEANYQASLKLSGDRITELQGKLENLKNARVGVGGLIDQLKGIAPAVDGSKGKIDATTAAVGLLAAEQKKLKDAQAAQPNLKTEAGLAANERLIASIQKRIRVLEDLGTAYGALGIINKKLADEEALRSKLSEGQLAASAERIDKLKEEKERLEDLGKASGIIGELQTRIDVLTRRIPKIKVLADVQDAYAELEQLQGYLEALKKPLKFKVEPELEGEGLRNFQAYLKGEIQKKLDVLEKGGVGLADFATQLNTAFLGTLNDQFKRGEISLSEYNAKRLKSEKDLQRDVLQAQLDATDQQLQVAGISNDQRQALESKKMAILRELYQQDAQNFKDAQDKKKAIEQAAFQAGVALINQYFANNAASLAEQLQNSQNAQAYEIELAGNTAGAKNKIDKKYKEQQDQLRKQQNENAFKQAVFERGLALAKIGIDTAKGVMAVLSTGGGTSYADFGVSAGILSALVIATGVAQAALVLSQPIQKFAKGTRFVDGPGSGTSDSVPAMLSRGEGVMPADVNRAYGPTLNAAYYGTIPADVLNKWVLDYPNYRMKFPQGTAAPTVVVHAQEIGEDLLDAISSQPQQHFNWNEDGFSTHTQRREHIKKSLNKRIHPNNG